MAPPRNTERSNRRLVLVICAIAVVGGALAGSLLFSKRRSPPPASTKSLPAPKEPDDHSVFSAYAQSGSCKSCHESEYQLWEHSHHGLAERPLNTNTDAVAFNPAKSIKHGSQTSRTLATNGQFALVTIGLDGTQKPFTPERVIGEYPLRQFMVHAPGGRFQVTELAFDPVHHDWFDVYGDEDRRPGEWGHWTGRGMTWNVMCAACHNTRLRKHFNEATDSYATTMAETTVGCEACHGPMAAHNAWQNANSARPQSTRSAPANDPTIHHMDREEMLAVCGSCHSRRAELTGEFHPGEKFPDHYALSIPDDTDLFYPDGQVHDEDYEYTAFLGSKMHAAGLRCADCHDSHSGKTRAAGNNLCMSCHASGVSVSLAPQTAHKAEPPLSAPAPKIDPLTHSHHELGKPGDNCVDCHMPATTYMQRHPRHDHGFTIPDPLLTKEFGIPNACGRCHKDQKPEWAIAAVDKWYGARMERPTRERARILARAKAGDNGRPAEIIRLLQTETNSFWRAVSAGFLRRWIGESNVAAALTAATKDPDPLVRSMSIRSLEPLAAAMGGVSAGSDAAAAVRAAMDDPVRSVRVDAAWVSRATVNTNTPAGHDLLQYLRFNGDQPSGAMQNGVFLMDRGDAVGAIHYLQRAVQWDTNSAPPHHALAVALSAEGKSEEAAQELQAACRLAPRDAELRFKLGLALNEIGNPEAARAALQEAVKLDPQYTQAWYNLGLAHNVTGDSDQALQSLLRAESLDANAPQIPYARATILARLGRLPEARAAARRAIEIRPDYADAEALLRTLGQ